MSADAQTTKLVSHLCVELSRLMKSEITDDVIYYLLSMETVQDLKDYVKELVDFSSPKAEPFLRELVNAWESFHNKENKTNIDNNNNKNHSGKESESDTDNLKRTSLGKSKKTTFSPLFGSDGKEKSAKLPGRHLCDCQSQKHPLVNNCIECGRVVCEQEGSGPCFFCGSLVCTKEEQEIISKNSKKSEKLKSFLMKKEIQNDGDRVGEVDADLAKALQHKNKLLEFDKTSVKRTKVIDDECDYFSTDSNKWLQEKERELLKQKEKELREQRFSSRLGGRKIDFDFAGREIRESRDVMYDASDDPDVMAANYSSGGEFRGEVWVDSGVVNPDNNLMKPKFVTDGSNYHDKSQTTSKNKDPHRLKIVQDPEVQMMSDEGMCLSMHQPWASLLVAGIKKHEGRTWYSSHRGTLWIAATSKKPDQNEIESMESFYRDYYQDEDITFPEHYPSSCLLGRVEVEDCLSEEDYKQQYPNGESESPFVFICGNPIELKVKFPMKGKHKIYKLEPSLHKGAKKALIWT